MPTVLTFLGGDPERPRGHAFLVFRDADNPSTLWATYLVVAPIALDIGKYIPAAFAGSLPLPGAADAITAYPLPPMPEKLAGGMAWVERLARLRGDDILDGGVLRVTDPWQAMHPVADVGRQYAERCNSYFDAAPREIESASEDPRLPAEGGSTTMNVDDLLLQVMPDSEKIGRLARTLGTLRYAVEGGDRVLADETVGEMERVGRSLAEKYRVADLIAAARRQDARGGQLAQVYVERCYKLAEEDYAAIPALDERIKALHDAAET